MPLSSFASTIKAIVNIQHKMANNPLLGMEGINAVESLAICVLAEDAKVSKQDLVRRIGARRGQGDRIIEGLEKRGFLTVSAGTDPKAAALALTDSGSKLHARLEAKWDEWIQKNPDSRSALASIRTGVRTITTTFSAA